MTEKMIIQKRFNDPNDWRWFNSSLDDCLDKTERAGYWKEGSVIKVLQSGSTVHTPFAEYRCTEYSIDGRTINNNF